jgi:hypothetical protein
MLRSRVARLVAFSLALAGVRPASASCGSWTPQQLSTITAGHDVAAFAIGDLDDDGDLDVVTVSPAEAGYPLGVHVHRYQDGAFQPAESVAALHPTDVALADMNGDHRTDIVVIEQNPDSTACHTAGACSSIHLLLDANDGTFSSGGTFSIPNSDHVEAVIPADFNKDGKMDVLVTAPVIAAGDAVHVFWGAPGAMLSTTNGWPVTGPVADATVADFNGDTYPDFAVGVGAAGAVTASHVDVFLNSGGVFSGVTSSRDLPSGSANLHLTTGLANADANLDIAVSMQVTTLMAPELNSGGAIFLLGNGSGTFTNGGSFAVSDAPMQDIAAADLDEDNKLDLVLPTSSGAYYVFYGSGDGNYRVEDSATARAVSAISVLTVDHDADGRPDVFFLDGTNDGVIRLRNVCASRYTATALTASANPSDYASNVTFTATVSRKPNAPVPTGTVTFYDGATVLGTVPLTAAATASITRNNLTLGSHLLHATYSGSGEFAASTSPNLSHTIQRPPFGPPLGVTATGNSATNQITISWVATQDATSHDVLRRDGAGQWAQIGTTSAETFTDVNVTPASAYVYTVRSHGPGAATTANGNLDIGTTAPTTVSTDRIIRASEFAEVRSLVNSLRAAAGLTQFTFTDATLPGKPIKAVHLTELRTALSDARSALGLPGLTYTQPTITPRVTPVKRADVQELKTSMY